MVRQICDNPDPRLQNWWDKGPEQMGSSDVGVATSLMSGDFRLPIDLIEKLGSRTTLCVQPTSPNTRPKILPFGCRLSVISFM